MNEPVTKLKRGWKAACIVWDATYSLQRAMQLSVNYRSTKARDRAASAGEQAQKERRATLDSLWSQRNA